MNAVVEFKQPRLPYHPAVQDKFGIDRGSWRALVEAIYPAADSVDSVILALSYCRARNLDPFKRPVHIVLVYDSKRRCMVETVWPGISELRTTAMRTNQYAGTDPMAYGPDVTKVLDGVEVTFPEWAQLTVYKLVKGMRVPFTGPEVYWLETYATAKRDTVAPNSMWRKRPRGQLQKCAEAAALRLAFPEEIGGEYAAEEMAGRAIGVDGTPLATTEHATAAQPKRLHAEFVDPQAEAAAQIEAVVEAHDDDTGEVIDPPHDDGLPVRDETPAEFSDQQEPALELADADFDAIDWAAAFTRGLDQMETVADVEAAWKQAKTNGFVLKLKAANPDMAQALADAVTARGRELSK